MDAKEDCDAESPAGPPSSTAQTKERKKVRQDFRTSCSIFHVSARFHVCGCGCLCPSPNECFLGRLKILPTVMVRSCETEPFVALRE